MLKTLQELVHKDKDYPNAERVWRHEWREQFRTSEIYNRLPHAFSVEKTHLGEYVPLSQRRPSVRFGLPRIIVNDSTSLLFSEGHFPAIDDTDLQRKEMWTKLIKETRLKEVMLDAAVKGSIGSVAILFSVKRKRVFWKVMPTQFLTPEYDPEEPDVLRRIAEQYKVKGSALASLGYPIEEKDFQVDFWFKREWNAQREVYFLPWRVLPAVSNTGKPVPTASFSKPDVVDEGRSKTHALGFVPLVWIKNLPGGDEVDGECTFECALHNSIEIDYQLSQAGRGLKYSSDPTLHIKDPAYDEQAPLVKSAANAIRTGPEGDVRVLEISGTASAAVLDYVRFVREISLEVAGGNRASPERLSGAQSGRAMELMNQSLIWLADKLRTSYGEYGLLPLLNMVVRANALYELKIKGQTYPRGSLSKDGEISLKWPPWYQPTAGDHQQMAAAINAYRTAGVISQRSAVEMIQHDFDIESVDEELARIKGEEEEKAKRELDAQEPPNASQPRPAIPAAA